MKKILLSVLISSIILGCSDDGSSGDDTPKPPVNKAPTIPSLVSPSNNLLCTDSTLEFKWNASIDTDGDAIKYKIEISKDNEFSSIDKSATVSVTNNTFTLEKGVSYYWRVEAVDIKNESSGYSSVFNLFTEAEGTSNHLPFVPQLISPELSSTIESGTTTLEWTVSDTDGDTLTYDVYFGEINPPSTLISESQSEATFNVNILPATTYFWKVVVKDKNGGETIGQIWGFSSN
jgi:hypothetical protein